MLNWTLLKNPANYVIVVLAVLLGAFLVDAVANISASYNAQS